MSSGYHFTGRERPVCPGASIGLIGGKAGTITSLVKRTDQKDGIVYALGCEHVLKPKNIFGTHRVVQPAMQDGVGTGRYNQVGISAIVAGLSEKKANLIDAAIVRLQPPISGSNFATNGARSIYSFDSDFNVDDTVTMIGRSSGVQKGNIIAIETEAEFDYQSMGWKTPLRFSALTKCDYTCGPGDSGAPVISNRTGKLIGLHFAGGEVGQSIPCGYFCAIWKVFEMLKIELI